MEEEEDEKERLKRRKKKDKKRLKKAKAKIKRLKEKLREKLLIQNSSSSSDDDDDDKSICEISIDKAYAQGKAKSFEQGKGLEQAKAKMKSKNETMRQKESGTKTKENPKTPAKKRTPSQASKGKKSSLKKRGSNKKGSDSDSELSKEDWRDSLNKYQPSSMKKPTTIKSGDYEWEPVKPVKGIEELVGKSLRTFGKFKGAPSTPKDSKKEKTSHEDTKTPQDHGHTKGQDTTKATKTAATNTNTTKIN